MFYNIPDTSPINIISDRISNVWGGGWTRVGPWWTLVGLLLRRRRCFEIAKPRRTPFKPRRTPFCFEIAKPRRTSRSAGGAQF